MPFKSQAQRRKFAQLLVEGKISNETSSRLSMTVPPTAPMVISDSRWLRDLHNSNHNGCKLLI